VSVTLCKSLTGVGVSGPEVLPVGQPADYTAVPIPWSATPPVTVTWDNGTVGLTATYSWPETGWQTIAVTATSRCDSEAVHGALDVYVCQPVSAVTVTGPYSLPIKLPGLFTATWSPPNATGPVTLTWSNGTIGAEASYSWTISGHHVVTATAFSTCGQVPGTTVVAVFGQIYLPLVFKQWNRCFLGHSGDFGEWEPNNNWAAAEQNGLLCAGQMYYGYPDDTYDLYHISSEAGPIEVTVANYMAEGAQLVLYDDNDPHRTVARDPGPGPDLHITAVVTESGGYYIMLYASGGYTTTTPYTLLATFPEP
jgi:hypothetical protein